MEKTQRVWFLQIALVALSMVAACSNADGDQDAWLAYRPSDTLNANAWVELPAARYSRVADAERGRAVGLLTQSAYVPLTTAEADGLVARPLSIVSGVPVLVRAVRTSVDKGEFRLFSGSESLAVFYGVLGDNGENIVHDGVVVVLEHEPAEVFVELSTAR